MSTGANAASVYIDNAAGGNQTKLQFLDAGSTKWEFGKQGDNSFYMWDSANSRDFLRVKTTGEVLLAPAGGNVGIGTTTPSELLHIMSTSNVKYRAETSGDDGTITGLELKGGGTNARWSIETNKSASGGAVDNLYFYKNSGTQGTKMVITDAGNVGIGTTSPAYPLDVVGAVHSSSNVFGTNFIANQNGTGIAAYAAQSDYYAGLRFANASGSNTADVNLVTAGTARITATVAGNVGIGTTNPLARNFYGNSLSDSFLKTSALLAFNGNLEGL